MKYLSFSLCVFVWTLISGGREMLIVKIQCNRGDSIYPNLCIEAYKLLYSNRKIKINNYLKIWTGWFMNWNSKLHSLQRFYSILFCKTCSSLIDVAPNSIIILVLWQIGLTAVHSKFIYELDGRKSIHGSLILLMERK